MGYTTDFFGKFEISPVLKAEHREYLQKFEDTRRMKRNSEICEKMKDPIRKKVGLPVGTEGEYFVGGTGFAGQDRDESIIDCTYPPSTQPGLWCQWVPTESGDALEWDGGEKFYNYVEWLQYLIDNFFSKWEYVLNGEVEWEGEDRGDIGTIIVKNNIIEIKEGKITYE